MKAQTNSMKGARTFLLGMLAGASVVAGGLVLARGHALVAPGATIIQSSVPAANNAASIRQTSADAPSSVELERALIVGHRLKIVVRRDAQARLA